jgi:hypothetical protein
MNISDREEVSPETQNGDFLEKCSKNFNYNSADYGKYLSKEFPH